jgi:cytochrome c553
MNTTPFLHAALGMVFALVCGAAAAQTGAGTPPTGTPEERLKVILQDPQQLEAYARMGQKVSLFCANCHGDGGNSVSSEVPNLAGQNPTYLLTQVRQFADGSRRFEFMERLIKAMSVDERLGVAVYYARQPVKPQLVKDAALVAKGKQYYDKICWRCHGEQGHGSESFARVAGQQTVYLTQTLQNYRGSIGTRVNPLMTANTVHMSDADLRAVVAYVSSMR